jgi:hypothetical protein
MEVVENRACREEKKGTPAFARERVRKRLIAKGLRVFRCGKECGNE